MVQLEKIFPIAKAFSDLKPTLEILRAYSGLRKVTVGVIPALPVQIQNIIEKEPGECMVDLRYVKNGKVSCKKIGPFSESIVDQIFVPIEIAQNAIIAEQALSNFLRPFLYDKQKKNDPRFATAFKTYKKVFLETRKLIRLKKFEEATELNVQKNILQDAVERHIIRLVGNKRFAIEPQNWQRL